MTKTFEFTPGLQLGIDIIDEQHAEFYVLMERLTGADATEEHRELVEDTLDALSEYVYTHFRTEENMMVKAGYPDFMEHHKKHAEFVGKVMEFNRKFRKGEIGLESEVLGFLVEWFTDHIREEDPKYVADMEKFGF